MTSESFTIAEDEQDLVTVFPPPESRPRKERYAGYWRTVLVEKRASIYASWLRDLPPTVWWHPKGFPVKYPHPLLLDSPLAMPYDFVYPPNKFWPTNSKPISPEPGTPNLLNIPREVQNHIFSYLLISSAPNHRIDVDRMGFLTFPKGDEVLPTKTEEKVIQEETPFAIWHYQLLKVLMINRQLRDQLVHLFFTTNTFCFEDFNLMSRFLTGIGCERRKYIGSVEVKDQGERQGYDRYLRVMWGLEKRAKMSYELLGESYHLQRLKLVTTPYVERRTWTAMHGIQALQSLRGLSQVEVMQNVDPKISKVLSNTCRTIGRESEALKDGLAESLTTPKILVGDERPDQVPARERPKKVIRELRELYEEKVEAQPRVEDEQENRAAKGRKNTGKGKKRARKNDTSGGDGSKKKRKVLEHSSPNVP